MLGSLIQYRIYETEKARYDDNQDATEEEDDDDNDNDNDVDVESPVKILSGVQRKSALRKAEASPSSLSTDGIEYLVGNGTWGDEPASQHTGGASHDDGYRELTISLESSRYTHYPSSSSEHGNILDTDSDELTTQPSVTAVGNEAGGLDISSTCGQPDNSSPPTCHARYQVQSELRATQVGLSHHCADHRGLSSAGRVYDVFADYEENFGKICTTQDDQKPRPRMTLNGHREPAAGGTATSGGNEDKASQTRDPLQAQKHRPKKRPRRPPTFDIVAKVPNDFAPPKQGLPLLLWLAHIPTPSRYSILRCTSSRLQGPP